MPVKPLQFVAACLLTLSSVTITQAGFYGRVLHNIAAGDTPSGGIETQRHAVVESAIGGKGSIKLDEFRIGAQIELGLADDDDGIERTRIQEFFISGDFGKVSIGTGPDSTWLIDAIDASETWVADPLGALFSQGAGGGAGAGGNITTKSFNGRVRYDSPKFAGIATISASLEDASLSANSSNGSTDGNDLSIASRINTGSIKLNAWTIISDNSANEHSGILVGYKHPSGFNISANLAESGLDIKTRAIKLGYSKDKHAYSIQAINTDYPNDLVTITPIGSSTIDTDGLSLSYVNSITKGVKFWARYVTSDGITVSDNRLQQDPAVIAIGGLVKF